MFVRSASTLALANAPFAAGHFPTIQHRKTIVGLLNSSHDKAKRDRVCKRDLTLKTLCRDKYCILGFLQDPI